MKPKECYEKFSPILWLKPEDTEKIISSDIIGRLLGISIVLNMFGYRKIQNPYLKPLILTDESLLTEVIINNGKIYSILPKKPLFNYVPLLREPPSRILLSKKTSNKNLESFFFWPLNWSPKVPKICKKPLPGLFKFDDQRYVGIPSFKPWNSSSSIKTINTNSFIRSNLEITLGPTKIYYKGKLFIYKKYFAVSESLDLLANFNKNIIYLNNFTKKELKLSCYDYRIYLLHPGGWINIRINENNAVELKHSFLLVISCPKGAFYASSPKGFKIYAEPGKVLLETKNLIVLGSGTYLSAVQALIETMTKPFEIQDQINIGIPRGEVVAILSELSNDLLKIFVWNPTPIRTLFETRLKHRIISAKMSDPLGNHDIFAERDLIKVPLPPNWIGCIEVKIKLKKSFIK